MSTSLSITLTLPVIDRKHINPKTVSERLEIVHEGIFLTYTLLPEWVVAHISKIEVKANESIEEFLVTVFLQGEEEITTRDLIPWTICAAIPLTVLAVKNKEDVAHNIMVAMMIALHERAERSRKHLDNLKELSEAINKAAKIF